MAQEPLLNPGASRTVRRRQPLVMVLAFAAVGILLDRYCPVPFSFLLATAAVLWVGWAVCYRCRWYAPATVCVLLCIALLAASWHHFRWHLCRSDDLGLKTRREDDPVWVEGIVHDGPRRILAHSSRGKSKPSESYFRSLEEGDRTRFVLRIKGVHDGSHWEAASGRAWVVVRGHTLGIHAGDRVRAYGHLVAPERPVNPGDFDSAGYHRRRGRLSVLGVEYPDGISRLSVGSPFYFWRIVEWLRNHCEDQLGRYISAEQNPLAMAILLGAREQLDFDKKEMFRATGTIHLMAISGLHVSILVSLFFVLARTGVMPVIWALVAAVVITLVYTLVADPRPPVVRATILTWMMCLAWHLGREAFSFNTLAAAGLAVLVINPCDLFNAGAQLSFLAVGTLAWFAAFLIEGRTSDPLQRLLAEARPWPLRVLWRVAGWFWKPTLASLTVWVISMPLVAYHFNVFSPVAVFLTPLLWIPVTLLLYAGFVVMLFGWLFPPAAMLFGWICNGLLWVLTVCVEGAQNLPAGHFWVPGPPLWWIVGFYGWLVFLVVFPALRPPRRWCWSVGLTWMLLGAVLPPAVDYCRYGGGERLAATFVSVGHGTSVLLELPDGQTVLYDAGGLGLPRQAADSISAVLWSRGLRRLDTIVLSHADSDHYNAVPRLLDRFSVGVIYAPSHMLDFESLSLKDLHDAAEEAGVSLRRVAAGDRLPSTDSVRLEVLHPLAEDVGGGDNENSVVLLVEFAGRRILLPGDLEGAGMQAVLARPPRDCDVVMAPHHGRQAANPAEFYGWCRPECIVISSRLDYGAMSLTRRFPEYRNRVLHTAYSGAVTVSIDRKQMRVQTWLSDGGR